MSNKEAQVDWDDNERDIKSERSQLAEIRLNEARRYSEGLEHRIEILNRLLDSSAVELAQARAELAAVDESLDEFYCPVLDPETDKPCGSFYKDRGVNVMRQALEMAEHVAAESGLEAEGLRRQLAKMEAGRDFWRREYKRNDKRLATAAEEAAIVEAAGALLKQPYIYPAKSTMEIVVASKKLQYALEHRSDAAAKLLERLVTLDAAESALAGCGIGGIYDKFSCLTDAIMQMSAHIKELKGEPVEVEITDTEIAEALQTEVQRRREAERGCWAARTLAENRGIQLETWEQRLECAEALAALVTPGLAEMLERLVWTAEVEKYPVAADHGREFATQIKEALDDSQI